MFQSLIGILQTRLLTRFYNSVFHVSIPHRYSTNRYFILISIISIAEFQSLIGILQTVGSGDGVIGGGEFQSLIGILQTSNFLFAKIVKSSFQSLIGILQTISKR